MSITYIKSLLIEDHIIKLPSLASWALKSQKVISIIATNFWKPQDKSLQLVEIGMLHINTQGCVQWTLGLIKPVFEPPAAWLKIQGIESLEHSSTWIKNWGSGIKHIATNNQVITLNQIDLDVIQSQYKNNNAPAFDTAIIVKDIYNSRNINKSATLNDMMLYYQVQADYGTLKGRILCTARILEAMYKEKPIIGIQFKTDTKTEDVYKWLIRSQAAAINAVDFFERVRQKIPYSIQLSNSGRLQGYSVFVEGTWKKGSEIDVRLAWPQLHQDHNWALQDHELESIKSAATQKW